MLTFKHYLFTKLYKILIPNKIKKYQAILRDSFNVAYTNKVLHLHWSYFYSDISIKSHYSNIIYNIQYFHINLIFTNLLRHSYFCIQIKCEVNRKNKMYFKIIKHFKMLKLSNFSLIQYNEIKISLAV